MKTYLSRAQSRFWAKEFPVGDPYGGPAFGEKNDPVSIVSSVAASALTNMFSGGGGNAGAGGGGQPAAQTSTYASDTAANIANDQWNYYKSNYQPLESSLVNQAAAAGSPEEYNRARGIARADVAGAFDAARKQSTSRMASYGINPGSPAFQSGMASTDLAEGAATAGAETAATNNTRNLAYSKALDVVGLGRNIPAQSAASSANAANAATAASRNLFAQNTANRQNAGLAVGPIVQGAAKKWFGDQSQTPPFNPDSSYNSGGNFQPYYSGLDSSGGAAYGAKGGRVTPTGFMRTRFAKGGLVGKHPITPHMRFASGGGVGDQGLEGQGATIDNETGQVIGPGTGTSDSVPAQIDGEQPAALSSGEFVMNAEVPKLSGDEILEAINQAGLKKREQGLEPQGQNGAPQEAAAYAEGGNVEQDEAYDARQTAMRKHWGKHYSEVTQADEEGESQSIERKKLMPPRKGYSVAYDNDRRGISTPVYVPDRKYADGGLVQKKESMEAPRQPTSSEQQDARQREAFQRGDYRRKEQKWNSKAPPTVTFAQGGPVGQRTTIYSGHGLGV